MAIDERRIINGAWGTVFLDGEEVAEAAIDKIDKDSKKKTKTKEGGEKDGKEEKTTTRRRKTTRTI